MNETILRQTILHEAASLRDAMLSFEQTGLQMVMIVDDQNHFVGLASEGDVRRALLVGQGLASPLLPFANLRPVTGNTSMDMEELSAMLSERVHFLPVLDEERKIADMLIHDRRTMIPVATPIVGEKELRYVTDAVLSGWISSQGKYIGQFETEFARFCGTNHGLAVSNGTVALHLALVALGIGPGDEVIVPALTFVATAAVVRHCHAIPVFVDVEEATWNMDPDALEAAITPRTKAIIPVHLYGMPCRMDRIMDIAKRHELWVVEDAAEAHGAEFQGRRVGSFGHMGCFSYYGNKIITTGEGGMVVTNDTDLDSRLRILRDHGMNPERRYWHDVVGYNYRMTNLQAAIGCAQLERWDQIVAAKDRIKRWYDEHLPLDFLLTPRPNPEMRPVCWLYSVLLSGNALILSRDDLLQVLRAAEIDGRPVFHPVPAMPPYYEEGWDARYPTATKIARTGLSLPSSVELDDSGLQRVCEKIMILLKDKTSSQTGEGNE